MSFVKRSLETYQGRLRWSMVVVLLFQLAGAATMWLHQSNNPLILGRYDRDFFAVMVAYHLMVIGWATLIVWLFANTPQSQVDRYQNTMASLVARPWLFWGILVSLWAVLIVFFWMIEFRTGTIHWLARGALVFSVGLVTLAFLQARGFELEGRAPHDYMPLATSLLTVLTLVIMYVLYIERLDLYHLAMREDGIVEWLTVVAYIGTAVLSFMTGASLRKTGQSYWFLIGLGLFCLFVAGEEVSWGQRLFGFGTPQALTQVNFQDEVNLHNVVPILLGTSSRKIYTFLVIGYGMVLPVLSHWKPANAFFRRHSIMVPTLSMLPLFLVIAPMGWFDKPTGREEEWAEMLFGFGFWITAILRHSYLLASGYLMPGGDPDSGGST